MKIWKIMIATGVMLILSALFLCYYNISENKRASMASQEVMTVLKEVITVKEDELEPENSEPDITAEEDIFAQYEAEKEPELKTVEVNGNIYCGYISIEKLGVELPVMAEWSYPNLLSAPCRYQGHPEKNDFLIAAHNYNSHFGRIKELNSGDELVFTDCDGNQYKYYVSYTEEIYGYDVDKMFSNQDEWDITLFTCTLGGINRVTVRAVREEQ